jgi:hypothetical protein
MKKADLEKSPIFQVKRIMTKKKGKERTKPETQKPPEQIVVTKDEFLRLRPIISPYVEQKRRTDTSLLLKLDTRMYKKRSIIKRFLPTPDFKRIQLDTLGMEVFLLCDGKNRIKDIMEIFQEKYKMTAMETQLSVQKFLISLTERHLIGYIIPKDIVKNRGILNNKIEKVILDNS